MSLSRCLLHPDPFACTSSMAETSHQSVHAPKCVRLRLGGRTGRSCNVFRISSRLRQPGNAMPGGGWGSLLCINTSMGYGWLWAICMPKQARNGQTTIVLSNSSCGRPWWCVGLSARLLASLVPLVFWACWICPLFDCFPSEWLVLGLEPFLITSWESSCRSRTIEPQLSEMHHKIR